MTKSEDIHRMLLNMALAPISTSIAAYKTAIKDITAYIDELEGKQVPKKPIIFGSKHIYLCPNCNRAEYIKRRDALDTHCGFCGQLIDWEEEE